MSAGCCDAMLVLFIALKCVLITMLVIRLVQKRMVIEGLILASDVI